MAGWPLCRRHTYIGVLIQVTSNDAGVYGRMDWYTLKCVRLESTMATNTSPVYLQAPHTVEAW